MKMIDREDNFFKQILKAMDEYAKQECFSFYRWRLENKWGWIERNNCYTNEFEILSEDELYSLYLKSKQNENTVKEDL